LKRSQAVKRLDSWFSKYIRLRDADSSGYVRCITCGTRKYWKEVDAGHFQTRAKYSTRWDERNVNAQCKGCNMVNGGQQYVHGLAIDKKFGEGTADELVILSNQIVKLSTREILDLAEEYKNKFKELESRL
jgi:hypothetical protein